MVVGLPGSGKSTAASELSNSENAVIHSSDSLREELFGNVNENERNEELFRELHIRIMNDLVNGNSIIYDATNVGYKRRKAVLDQYKKVNCEKICYLIATPFDLCMLQNSKRERNVAGHVLKKMYKNFFAPQDYEGWDKIKILWNFDETMFDLGELMTRLSQIAQDNPHHTLTIGEHCIKCEEYIHTVSENILLQKAGLLHDIGKEFTKEFRNTKGEETEIAHFYNHQSVSAYDALFYLKALGDYSDDQILKICNYIQWHMQPYNIKTGKAKKKFINLVGEAVYNDLLLLNEGDINAK